MKSKAKWFLLASFAALLVVSLPACAQTEAPTLTDKQVISIIQVYGVPYNYYEGYRSGQTVSSPQPVGQWAAAYEGRGQWRVQGTVVAVVNAEERYCSTTWIYREDVNEIRLINFTCH